MKNKKDLAGIRVLTPPTVPGANRDAASGGTGSGTGGNADSSAAQLGFSDFYGAARRAYAPALVELADFDSEEEAKDISGWLRPSYDDAIADRERRTDTYSAELDADALSRGMGRSTYVTDVKSRQQNEEARDIAALESDYGAKLLQYLSERQTAYEGRRSETDLFNADAVNTATQKAYQSAMTLYKNYLSVLGSSGGSGRAKKSAAAGAAWPASASDLIEAVGDSRDWSWARVADTDPELVMLYLSHYCTPEERDQIYYGNASAYDGIRREILKSLGTLGTRAAHWDSPGNEKHEIKLVY